MWSLLWETEIGTREKEGGTLDEKEEAGMKERRFREPRRAVAGGLLEVGGHLHALRVESVHHAPPTSFSLS